MHLIEPTKTELTTGSLFEVLQDVKAENRWLANFSSANTRRMYQFAVGSFIQTIGIQSSAELYQVTQAHVIAWRSAMEQAGLSQATIANRLSALSSLYKELTDRQLCSQNPVSGVKRPRTGNGGTGAGKSPSLLSKHVRALLDAPNTDTLQGLRDRALLHVYFYTGARRDEPGALRVKDKRFDREYTVLDFTVKGGKRNTVAIHPECARAINDYLERADHSHNPDAFLFQPVKHNSPGQRPGGRLSGQQCYRLFVKYAVAAGLPEGVYTHMARSTFITEAYAAGVAGEAIQRTVGHSSITTTEGYNKTITKHRDSASLKMGY